MKIYSLKSIARRGGLLGAAFALFAATVAPATSVFADALNPLTNRSLTLSSSSPGWSFTDGSGNAKYAPPNSGANGQKTGNTFEFNVSTDGTAVGADPVKTMTFQYCTTSAGLCRSPGDNASAGVDTTSTSDLKVVTSSPAEVGSGNFSTIVDNVSGRVVSVPGFSNPDNPSDTTGVYAAKNVSGNFVVYYLDVADTTAGPGGTWKPSSGWSMSTVNVENATATLPGLPTKTNQNNYIILKNATGETFKPENKVKIVFFGTANNYIQNPGSGAFFVKINTYNKEYVASGPTAGQTDLTGLAPASDANVIDGGVTVANVMNQSIQITTKVLETMQFSVGTVDPNTLDSVRPDGSTTSELDNAHGNLIGNSRIQHQVCDTVLKAYTPADPANVLKLGDQDAESSLSTEATYSTHSYWRLSSNSSAGATVYYSGHTLSNTVGDQIKPIGAAKAGPAKGAEQFGLALANTSNTLDTGYGADTSGSPVHQNFSVNYAQEQPYENGNDNGKTAIHTASLTTDGVIANASWHAPRLYPLVADSNYDNGTGTINTSPTTEFAFDPTSDTIPVALATEDDQVVDCVTGKMRYIANIAATTPAGIYTTKINYIAAPQY